MLAGALVVFREVLEAMLIIAVVLAATKGVARRWLFIALGVGAGIAGSVMIAVFAAQIAAALEGNGQEIFNAGIMFTVTVLLTWHIVWMQRHGRELANEMRHVGEDVKEGRKPLAVLAAVIALAVWREGSEIVLFMHGLLSSQPAAQVMGGFALGAVAGVAVGAVLYLGLLRLKLGVMFAATNVLLALIAAGMAARGAGLLIQVGYLPPLADPLWDASGILPETSTLGSFLAALIGYIAQPSGMQMVFYGVTLALITVLMALQRRAKQSV